jgi:hypothetical protein
VQKTFKRLLEQAELQGLHQARLLLRRSGFSEFNEEQILLKYINQLLADKHSRIAVDIGAADGIRRSNTYALFRNGWKGLGVECDNRQASKLALAYKNFPHVAVSRCRVTPNNVVPMLQDYGIEPNFSVLSLDIDGNDYWVLDALLQHFRPRLIVTEVNEKIPPPIKFVVKYNPDFQLRHHFYGYSIMKLEELTDRHNYSLLELEYNNAFLAPKELAGQHAISVSSAYRQGYLERPDRKEKFPDNRDMEILHTLTPEEGVKFLKQFYAKFQGQYEISL